MRDIDDRAPVQTGRDPIRVLLVDDMPDVLELTKTFLGRVDERFDIVTETSADAGLTRLTDDAVDCVVSDYNMPGMNGLEFLEVVRERDPERPFILFTGRGSEEVASDAISAGVTDYLQKGTGHQQYELLANRILNGVARHRAELRMQEHERISTVVRRVNQVLVRASSTDTLEQEVCKLISHSEPYLFAWIGSVDSDAQTLVPRAAGERDAGYLDEVTLKIDDSPEGRGPAGRSVRNQTVQVAQNIREDPSFEPWCEQALARGFRSVAAVPLVYQDELYGVLKIYSGQAYAFDESEQELLAEVGADIAHALHSLKLRDELQESEARFKELAENISEVVWMRDAETGETVYVNPTYETVWGRPVETAYERPNSFTEAIHPDDRARVVAAASRQAQGAYDEEYRIKRPDGTVRWIRDQAVPVPDGSEKVSRIVGVATDITAQRERQETIDRERHRYEQILKTVPGCIVQIDADGQFVFANDSAIEILGRSEAEISTLTYNDPTWRLTEPDGTPVSDEALPFRTVRDTGEPVFGEEKAIEWPDGTRRTLSVNGAPILSDDGAVESCVFTLTDVTNRRERERELRSFKKAVDHAGNSIYLTTVDGTIEYVNPAFEVETGYTSAEAVGNTPSILKSGEYADEFYADLWGTILDGQVWSGEIVNKHKNGSQYVINQTIAPIQNESGGIERFVSVTIDVTDAREREVKLTESERLFRAVFERAFDAMLIANDEGEYTDVNPAACELLGVSRDELIGCTPVDFAAPGYDVERAWEAFLQSDRDRGLFPLQRSDGTEILVEFAATPRILPGRHLSVLRDVTELHDSKQQLERQRNKIHVLNRVLRHDIRNDANVILGYAELLKEGETNSEEAADAILNRANDLVRLSDQARGIETLSSEEPAGKPVDVASRLREIVDQYAADYPDADIRFEGPESVLARAIGLIDSAFDNLLENALEHSDRSNPVVTVRVADHIDSSPDVVSIEVEDDGPGIPSPALEVIETGDETPLEHAHGLGLWLVSWIVSESDGSVEFE
jgi:PAS domain S-box-containing protein